MKEKNRKEIIVTEYETDFGQSFKTMEEAFESEKRAYRTVYRGLKNGSLESKLVNKLLKELYNHHNNAYCEIGIGDDIVAELVDEFAKENGLP